MTIRNSSLIPLRYLALCLAVAAACAQTKPSPAAKAEIDLGGKSVTISYGRPSMRGRPIMGSLVPYGEVWRTGANEATQLSTAVDLMIGDLPVPAGKYSLYTLPREDSWRLIVNKQTGQWGTEYDAGQDLGRPKMEVKKLSSPAEQFTIRWDKKSATIAELVLEWENTSASIPVKAAGQ